MQRPCGVVVLVLVLLSVAPALAQPEPEAPPATEPPAEPAPPPEPAPPTEKELELEKAKKLFFQGNELRKAGDYERALVFYEESRELVASVPNTTNAAICLDKLGRFDEALERYEELLTMFSDKLTQEDRDAIAPEMAKLRRKVGSVDVRSNTKGSLVIDGRPRGSLPMVAPSRVLPGQRVVQVMSEGYRTYRKTIEVNHPLHYGGYHFYQKGHDTDDLSYARLTVTSDSGLWAVYAGFALLVGGAFWRFWVRPMLAHRRRAGGQ